MQSRPKRSPGLATRGRNGTPDSSTQLPTSSAWYVRTYGRSAALTGQAYQMPARRPSSSARPGLSTVPVNRSCDPVRLVVCLDESPLQLISGEVREPIRPRPARSSVSITSIAAKGMVNLLWQWTRTGRGAR